MHLPTYARIPIPSFPNSFPNLLAAWSRWRFVAVVVVLPLLGSCEAPLDAATFCPRYVDANLAMMRSCGLLAESHAEQAKTKLLSDCTKIIASRSGPSWEFSVSLAKDCIDQVSARACFAWVESCQTEHPATKYGYDSCGADRELAHFQLSCFPFVHGSAPQTAGAVCDRRMGCGTLSCELGDHTCGVCTVPEPVNSSCKSCDYTTHYCDSASKTCLPLKPEHAACTSRYECLNRPCTNLTCDFQKLGAMCVGTTDCGPTAYCNGWRENRQPGPFAYGVCTQRIPTGSACTDQQFDDGCAEKGATCLEGICKVVPPRSLSAGQVCDAQVQCAPPLFCAGLLPNGVGNGVCKDAILSEERGRCGYSTTLGCRYPLQCSLIGICQQPALSLINEACEGAGDANCIQGTCQQTAPGLPKTCQPLLDDGADCTFNQEACVHERCILDCPTCTTSHCAPPC